MSEVAAALDLSCFAYLLLPCGLAELPQLISTYPIDWTRHYLEHHYERLDPVIARALHEPDPFQWGIEISQPTLSDPARELFAEAARFGIRHGYTIPIHDSHGAMAAVTFATDERRPLFERSITEHARVLQLMAMCFHSHARRKLMPNRLINGVALSRREIECLHWAAQGKSAWDTARILGISRHTVAFHLDNARAKLGVRSTIQAVACLSASEPKL
jgi:DNA-binding CsgD family transcriptional regulator